MVTGFFIVYDFSFSCKVAAFYSVGDLYFFEVRHRLEPVCGILAGFGVVEMNNAKATDEFTAFADGVLNEQV